MKKKTKVVDREAEMEKMMLTHILFGIGSSSYQSLNLKRPLGKVSRASLQYQVDQCNAGLKDGEKILNTNLEALGIIVKYNNY